jgi:NADPH2:quinone reductase
MKEAIVAAGPKVTIQDIPIPDPKDDQVVIKVIVSGSNPKDWYVLCSSYHVDASGFWRNE